MPMRETEVEGYAAVTLSSPHLEATFVPRVAMIGASLVHDGVELLDRRGGLARYAEKGSTMGMPLLHPWANRLAGFGYTVGGRSVVVDPSSLLLHKDGNGLPMHGVQPRNLPWQVVGTNGGAGSQLSVRLAYEAPHLVAVFPFPHELRMDVGLHEATLTVTTTLRPSGTIAVPVSFGFHPYLRLPDVPRGEWWVELPVRRRLVLDERQIPTGATEPVTIPAGPLAAGAFDAGFDRLDHPARFVLAGGGRRVTVEFVEGFPCAQVYAPVGESFICFEPMTAPTNALVSGAGLTIVEPGAAYTATFAITIECA